VVIGNGLRLLDEVVSGEIRPLCEIERETIVETLQHFHGHRQKTAKALGIGVRTLGLKLKKWKEEELVPRRCSGEVPESGGPRRAVGPRFA
jgi:transcriptional regulator with AAA-type ATPase domain